MIGSRSAEDRYHVIVLGAAPRGEQPAGALAAGGLCIASTVR